jgi:putative serine protease PepD
LSASSPRRRQGWWAILLACIAILLAGGGYVVARVGDSGTKSGSATPTTIGQPATTAPPVVNVSGSSDEPIAAVAAALSPSVVQIETRDGLGSGFVYDTDGHIMTAAHVVSGAGNTVNVRLADGSVRTGQVLGSDNQTDIAVVKVDGNGLKAATLATGIRLQVGQTAVAIGSPFGLDQTVTAGIISAIDRAEATVGGAIGMIQTDAPINPGNSGGPLADKQGRVIGINDQIATDGTSQINAGVGFAVPIDVAKAVADKIVAGQPVEFGFLGVSTQGQQLSASNGAVVTSVSAGSPAAKAGITEGDEITAIDGVAVRDPVELGARVRSHKPGDTVKVTVKRNGGQESTLEVTLGSTRTR